MAFSNTFKVHKNYLIMRKTTNRNQGRSISLGAIYVYVISNMVHFLMETLIQSLKDKYKTFKKVNSVVRPLKGSMH